MESIKIVLLLFVNKLREHAQRARQSATIGATTVEYILMALLGIAIAGIVAVAVTAWVNRKTSQLG